MSQETRAWALGQQARGKKGRGQELTFCLAPGFFECLVLMISILPSAGKAVSTVFAAPPHLLHSQAKALLSGCAVMKPLPGVLSPHRWAAQGLISGPLQ